MKQKKLSPSQEDYLEAIFHIEVEKKAARAKDIAKKLKVKGASVTGALRVLAEKKFINYSPYDVITLTHEGKKMAEDVVRRHEVLHDFFERVLGVEPLDAERGACEMEHSVPRSVLDKLIQFVEFIDICPRAGTEWMEAFTTYCNGGKEQSDCIDCTNQKLEDIKGKYHKEMQEGKKIEPLHVLNPGQKGKIVRIRGGKESAQYLKEKGLIPGLLVEVEEGVPRPARIEIKLKGYHLSMRKSDADNVMIEVLQ